MGRRCWRMGLPEGPSSPQARCFGMWRLSTSSITQRPGEEKAEAAQGALPAQGLQRGCAASARPRQRESKHPMSQNPAQTPQLHAQSFLG